MGQPGAICAGAKIMELVWPGSSGWLTYRGLGHFRPGSLYRYERILLKNAHAKSFAFLNAFYCTFSVPLAFNSDS